MPKIKLSKELSLQAKITGKTQQRTIAQQIEHWVKIGRVVEENSDLTYEFIKNILIAQQEA